MLRVYEIKIRFTKNTYSPDVDHKNILAEILKTYFRLNFSHSF